MNTTIAHFLLSPAGGQALTVAAALPPGPAHQMANLTYLRHTLSLDQAGAVWEQVELRRQAAGKFTRAAAMLFTSEALQQASSEPVARHKAARFAGRNVIDLTCGIGGDTLALAAVTTRCLAAEQDLARLLLARHNCAVYETPIEAVQMDALAPALHDLTGWAVFADPGRRSDGRRRFDPAGYQPPLDQLQARYAAGDLAVKVAPGIDYSTLPWVTEVEIVSLGGDVKEAVLWTGGLVTPDVHRRATLLPTGATLTDADAPDACPLTLPAAYLYEPDGAVIRAGLVRPLAHILGLSQIDPQIAYLTGSEAVATPFARGFAIDEVHPFNLKALNRRLQELGVGTVELKKRGIALEPEALRPRLKLRGSHSRTIIFTRIGDIPWMFICRSI